MIVRKTLIRIAKGFGALALCFIAFVAWAMLAPPVPMSRLEQVHLGMSKEQVRTILGKPPNAYKGDDGSESWVYARMTWSLLDIEFSPEGMLTKCALDK